MSSPPLRTALYDTYPNPSNAVARTGLGALWDYTTSLGMARCRLSVSAGNIFLQPYQGNHIIINGEVRTIPSAGVGLAPTGLVVGTLYYIYAYMSGSTMTLEASTTIPGGPEANTGTQVKSTDITRTLVGMARPTAGPTFTDSVTQRFVINWFNRLPLQVRLAIGSNASTASLTPVGIAGPVEFLSWAGSAFQFNIVGGSSNSVSGGLNFTYLALNSATPVTAAAIGQASAAGAFMPACLGATIALPSVGHNAVYCSGSVSAGTGTWQSGLEISGQVFG